jgi:hypothetical protein
MRVFVLDRNRKPLDPCSTGTAWKLLKRGRAAVFKRFPFTIILKDRTLEESVVHPHRLKIDPGSKITGMAVIQEESGRVVAATEVEHRGQAIRKALDSRHAIRGGHVRLATANLGSSTGPSPRVGSRPVLKVAWPTC